jgi:plasmid segregation protein ParM
MEQTSTVPEEQTQSLKSYACGYDFGNSEIGIVILKPNPTKGKADVIQMSIPTAFTQLNPGLLKNMGADSSKATIIRMKNEHTSYGIGEVALRQNVHPWNGRGDIHRYSSQHSLRALLALSASLVPEKDYRLTVITGLPVQTYQSNTALQKEIKEALSGKWTFTTDSGRSWRTCQIDIGGIVMEGAGALMAYGNGKDALGAVIDIGGRTTDLYVAQHHVPIIDFCQGTPIGVGSATHMMMQAFETKYGVPLRALEARDILFAYAEALKGETPSLVRSKRKTTNREPTSLTRPQYPEITVSGSLVDWSEIHALASEGVKQTTAEIVSFVSSAWRQSDTSDAVGARFHPIILIGGGTYYFFHALKRVIPHLSQPTDPVYANAFGYAKAAESLLAKRQARSKG